MTIALDVITVFILVFTIWRAAAKGFIRAVFDMLKFTISVICAIVFKNGLASAIINSGLYDKARNTLRYELSDSISRAGEKISSQEMLEAFKTENPNLVKLVESMGADLDKTRQAVENAAIQGSENLSEIAAEHILGPAMESVAHIIAFALIFIVVFILLWIAENILDALFGLPVLHTLNRVGGVIVGILCAVLYVSLFVSVTSPILSNPTLVGGEWDSDVTRNTYVYSYIEDHNILSIFIE